MDDIITSLLVSMLNIMTNLYITDHLPQNILITKQYIV